MGLFHSVRHTWLPGLLLLIPWLSAYTAGPTPGTWPWLISAYCVGMLLLLRHLSGTHVATTTWVLAAGISAAMGLLQYFGHAYTLSPWVSIGNPGEAFGNLRQRNQFATLTSIGLVALLGLLAQRGRERPVPLWVYPVLALLALGNAGSNSRTGLFEWLLILALALWWARPALCGQRRLGVFAILAVSAYGLAVMALPWLLTALTGLESAGLFGRLADSSGCAGRRVLWSNVLHLIVQKPWLGWGWGDLSYAHFVTLYPGERFCDILDNAHNLPLHLAVELGVPFAAAACTVVLWCVAWARPWRETDPTRQMAWGVLAVIGLHSLLEYPLWYGPFQIAVGLCLWLLWSRPASAYEVAQDHPAQQPGVSTIASIALRALLAVLMLAALTYAAWDYWRVSQLYLPQEERAAAYRDDTLDKVRNSWLFQNQVEFAELTTTQLTSANATQLHAMAERLLHFSPEPRVVEKLIESAVMLGRDNEALFYLKRRDAAFPKTPPRWVKASARHEAP